MTCLDSVGSIAFVKLTADLIVWPNPNLSNSTYIIFPLLNVHSDVLHKTHQPGLFFTDARNAASEKIIYLAAFYTVNYPGLNEPEVKDYSLGSNYQVPRPGT